MEEKRFPADTKLDVLTFLNDKQINGELYAFLQSISDYLVIDKKFNFYSTYVPKKNLPTQKKICQILGIGSPKTLRKHLTYLCERGYLIPGGTCEDDQDVAYYLPELEDIYFLIPLKTIQYLRDNCKEHVFKIYIYLGQKFKMAIREGRYYEFSLKEIGQHIGLKIENYSRGYEVINNALDLLVNSGLIDYAEYFENGVSRKKLTKFSFEYRSKNGK